MMIVVEGAALDRDLGKLFFLRNVCCQLILGLSGSHISTASEQRSRCKLGVWRIADDGWIIWQSDLRRGSRLDSL